MCGRKAVHLRLQFVRHKRPYGLNQIDLMEFGGSGGHTTVRHKKERQPLCSSSQQVRRTDVGQSQFGMPLCHLGYAPLEALHILVPRKHTQPVLSRSFADERHEAFVVRNVERSAAHHQLANAVFALHRHATEFAVPCHTFEDFRFDVVRTQRRRQESTSAFPRSMKRCHGNPFVGSQRIGLLQSHHSPSRQTVRAHGIHCHSHTFGIGRSYECTGLLGCDVAVLCSADSHHATILACHLRHPTPSARRTLAPRTPKRRDAAAYVGFATVGQRVFLLKQSRNIASQCLLGLCRATVHHSRYTRMTRHGCHTLAKRCDFPLSVHSPKTRQQVQGFRHTSRRRRSEPRESRHVALAKGCNAKHHGSKVCLENFGPTLRFHQMV